jgi:hypothetical protein
MQKGKRFKTKGERGYRKVLEPFQERLYLNLVRLLLSSPQVPDERTPDG